MHVSIEYWGKSIDARVTVDKKGGRLMFSDDPEGQLQKHITIASTLAYDMPIQKSTTCTTSDVPFGMDPEDGTPLNADQMTEDELDDWMDALNSGVTLATTEICNKVINPNGLTCFDVLRSAANVSVPSYLLPCISHDLHVASIHR